MTCKNLDAFSSQGDREADIRTPSFQYLLPKDKCKQNIIYCFLCIQTAYIHRPAMTLLKEMRLDPNWMAGVDLHNMTPGLVFLHLFYFRGTKFVLDLRYCYFKSFLLLYQNKKVRFPYS